MKWVQIEVNGKRQFGVLDGDTIITTSLTWQDILAGKSPDETGQLKRDAVKLLIPLARPGKIVSIGLNYMDHCREQNVEPPKRPLIFTKFTTAMIATGETIAWSPELTQKVDFEAELAVIIGKTARHVSEDHALDYVFGYTAANDVTARDLQKGDGQWVRGKSLDTFCPLGPVTVTADEIPDPQNLQIGTRVNDGVMQASNTAEMIFSVKHLISFCSQAFTLEPGDIILTGTPHGVGVYREPPVFLKDGDRIEVEVENIGKLINTCKTF